MHRAENLRCLRDPEFKNHPWHAGHMSSVTPADPRALLEAHQCRRSAGRRAFNLVKSWNHYWARDVKLKPSQQSMLVLFIRNELLSQL